MCGACKGEWLCTGLRRRRHPGLLRGGRRLPGTGSPAFRKQWATEKCLHLRKFWESNRCVPSTQCPLMPANVESLFWGFYKTPRLCFIWGEILIFSLCIFEKNFKHQFYWIKTCGQNIYVSNALNFTDFSQNQCIHVTHTWISFIWKWLHSSVHLTTVLRRRWRYTPNFILATDFVFFRKRSEIKNVSSHVFASWNDALTDCYSRTLTQISWRNQMHFQAASMWIQNLSISLPKL